VLLAASGARRRRASVAGIAGAFEALRPYLLVTTALLLGAVLFLAYRRRAACGPDDGCSEPAGRGMSRIGVGWRPCWL